MDSNTTTVTWRGQWLGYIGLGLLVGFMFAPYSYYVMAMFPWLVIWQAGFLLLGISLLVMIRQFNRPFRPLGYGLDWAVGAVAIACILSTVFAPFKGAAFWNLTTISGYLVVIYTVRNWLGTGLWTWHKLWRSLAFIGLGMSATGLLSWFFLEQTDRNLFPLGHHNFVSAYLCLVVPIILSFALAQTGKQRFLFLLFTGIIPYHLYTTSSRGGFLGFLVWAIATIGFVIWRTKGKKRLILGAVALFSLVVMLTAGLQHPRVQQIIQIDTSQTIPTVQFKVDGETEDRLFMWQAGLNILKDRPLTGTGLGNMSRLYNLYRPINAGAGASHIQQLHSTPVQLLGELGLIGGAAIAFLLVQLIRLGWRIHARTEDPNIKRLLYGIGGSWFAYGVATLTDYQLENIPISLTLTFSVILLLSVADQELAESQPQALAIAQRRLLSLGSLGATLAALVVAMPYTYGMNLFAKGQYHWAKGSSEAAFDDIATAYGLNQWNPTYPLRLGLWLLETRSYSDNSPEKELEITKLATQYFLDAWALIPNDYYMTVNVGVLLSEIDPIEAQPYLERAVQLLQRELEPTYLLLGQSYLAQGEKDRAIAAFAIQGLIDPGIMTLALWDEEPLMAVRLESVERCLDLHQKLIDALDSDDPYRVVLQERMAWIAWWNRLPIPHEDQLDKFSPMVQALLSVEQQPEKALEIVKEQLKIAAEDKTPWLILQIWLDPSVRLKLPLKSTETGIAKEYMLASAADQGVALQDWLKQVPFTPNPTGTDRFGSRLLYRNQDFEAVDTVFRPRNLTAYRLLSILGLSGSQPRTFPELDRLIDEVRTQELGLPHPTENHFQIKQ